MPKSGDVPAATSSPYTWLGSALTEVRTANYDLPNVIGGNDVRTNARMPVVTPHAHAVTLGQVHRAGPAETEMAIEAALAASGSWGRRTPEQRTTRSCGRPICSSGAHGASA